MESVETLQKWFIHKEVIIRNNTRDKLYLRTFSVIVKEIKQQTQKKKKKIK